MSGLLDQLTRRTRSARPWGEGRNQLHRAARWYGARGFKPVPLGKGTKAAIRSFRASSSDPEGTEEWSRNHRGNLGIVVPPGMLALDFDSFDAAIAFATIHQLPATACQITPRGAHVWLRIPAADRVRQKSLQVGIDLRCAGRGYLVVEPSETNRGSYYWLEYPETVAEAPESVIALLPYEKSPSWSVSSSSVPSAGGVETRTGSPSLVADGASVGTRNQSTFSYACSLRARGLSRAEALVLCLAVRDRSEHSADDPFTVEEVTRIVAGAYDRYPGANSGRLKVDNVEEFVAERISEPEWLVEGLLREKALVMVYAPRGLGKTWFGLSLAVAVAMGGPFLKWPTTRRRRVLYVDGEMSAFGMQARLRGLGASGDLRLICSDRQDGPMPSLGTEAGRTLIDEQLDGVSLLVLDSRSTLVGGAENDAETFEELQRWFLSLRRRGIAVVLVHHSGKNGDQRGTSKHEDILDLSIRLNPEPRFVAGGGARFGVEFTKNRNSIDDSPFSVSLAGHGSGLVRLVVGSDEVQQLSEQGLSPVDIADRLGVNKATVYRRLQALGLTPSRVVALAGAATARQDLADASGPGGAE